MFFVTNDDGDNPLYRILLECCRTIDGDAVSIVPDRQRSATSKALTFHKPLKLKEMGSKAYSLNGTPADCVALGLHLEDVLPKEKRSHVKYIVSGINKGLNVSVQSFFTSGTVGACIEGLVHGRKGIAFSIEYAEDYTQQTLQNVSEFCKMFLHRVATYGIPKSIDVINVNFPKEVKNLDFRISELSKKYYDVDIMKGKDPEGKTFYWLGGITHKCGEYCKDKECHNINIAKKITVAPLKLTINYDANALHKMLTDR